jgi:hypothetical protein
MQSVSLAQSLDPPKPLNEAEKRLLLVQLYELESARAKILAYEDFILKEKDLDSREKAIQQQAIDNEKRSTDLARGERDLAQEQAKFYKDLYTTVSKKRGGVGCFFKKLFTLGIARCGG